MTKTPCGSLLLTTAVVFFGLAATTLAAGPAISFDTEACDVRLVQKSELGGEANAQFLITAKGAKAVAEVYGNVTGVLFQAAAVLDERLESPSIDSQPVELSYQLRGDHDAVLRVARGNRAATSHVPAWVWAVAAQFANHEATAAITMRDDPQTAAEKRFRQHWLTESDSHQRLIWVRYHPKVADTLVGLFLFTADAMLADAGRVRTITNGLIDFGQYSGYAVTMDAAKCRRAARTLDGLVALESQPGDCAMLNDVDERFGFTLGNGELRIGGGPSYHFARRTAPGDFTEVPTMTEIFRKNRHVVRDVNPLVYTVVDDFARLVALFNYVGQTDPDELAEFVGRLQPVLDRIPTIETPIAVVLGAR